MQPVEVISELDAAIVAVAKEHNLAVARDTHYDAFNVEMRWWHGNHFHRLDFQPFPEGHVVVTYLVDSYPFLGRLLRGAWQFIPMFPYLAKTEHKKLGTLMPPFNARELRAEINEYLAKAALPVAPAE